MPGSGLSRFDSALEPQKPSNKRPKFTFLEMVSYDAAEERGSYVFLEGASVELWSCMAQVLVPVRTPEKPTAGPHAHPPHLGGYELHQLSPGVIGAIPRAKGSPRVDFVDRCPSRGHFSSRNKFP